LFTARSVGVATDYSLTVSPLQATAPDFWGTPSGASLTNGLDATSNPDTGTATVTVNGTSYQISYGGGDTSASIASRLAIGISAGSWANASASSGTLTITAKNPGPGGDYSLSAPPTTFDSVHFSAASFSVSPQASALSGGYSAADVDNQPLRTLYSYDALGNLLCVEQHGNVTGTGCSAAPTSDASSPWRVRRFTYDSLSRLLTAHNPESGTITYLYDADGNLLQKTSPAPNQTGSTTQTISFCYDELHRVKGKAYSAQSCPLTSPVVTYTYDSGANAKGKLTSLTDQAGTATFSYDNLGRTTSETRAIAGVSKSISYEYNLGGSLAKLHYPSGRVVTYTPDSAGRIISAADSNGTQYVTSATYYANGSEFQRSYPGIYFSTTLNPRLQVAGFYSDNGLVGSYFMNKTYNYGALHQNNGNINSIVDNKDASRTQTFTYDILNRITSGYSAASTGAFSWGETYSVDPWGNLNIGPMGNKAHGGTFANASDNNNRPLGFTYDAAGNLTNTSQYVYDPENRIQSTAGTAYTYDADGQRVLKSNSSTGAALKRYWMGNGNVLAEADGSGNLTAEYIYFNGKRIARIDLPANSVHYYLSDHLGSSTKVISGGVVEEESDFTAFGSELSATSGANHYKFTSKERDTETGLDYFGARYYSNGLGRWVTPDAPFADQHLQNPQSWNLYMYAANRPTSLIDTDGREVKETVKTVTYDVHGKTAAEAHANALATSGLKAPESGEAMMGVTKGSTQIINIVQTSQNEGYEGLAVTDVETVKSADVKLDQTITMPNWVDQNQASPEDQAAWNTEMSGLKEHEDGHVEINSQGAHELDKSLPGTKGVGGGSTAAQAHAAANKKLGAALSKKGKDEAAKTGQRQVDYDKKTDHGRKQHEEQK
jgi:RHS repeat-associated protein